MAKPEHVATLAVRAGIESDTQWGAVIPPVHLSAKALYMQKQEQVYHGHLKIRLTTQFPHLVIELRRRFDHHYEIHNR